jgi:prephenate dehydrogenase
MPEAAVPVLPRVIALVGAGLIGGSLALALRRCQPELEVRVFDRDPGHSAAARRIGIATRVCADLAAAVEGAPLVVLAVPVGALPEVFAALASCLGPDAWVTDVGSSKCSVIDAARGALGSAFARFVPGHPISGAERSGPEAADAALFVGRRVVLTPTSDTDPRALATVRRLWELVGAEVGLLDPAQHDRVFAAVSHLPHLLSYALVEELAGRGDAQLLFSYAAGGFRDFTRIAASHPGMWRDIALANRDAVLSELDVYLQALQRLRHALAAGDGAALQATFERARAARLRWAEAGSSASVSNPVEG